MRNCDREILWLWSAERCSTRNRCDGNRLAKLHKHLCETTPLILSGLDWFENTFFVSGVSFNQPKLCPNATWNENGTIFSNSSTIGSSPQAIFINKNNTVYATNEQNGLIRIWLENSSIPTSTVSTNSTRAYSVFVTLKGDIYIDNESNNRTDVWREDTTACVSTLYTGGGCSGTFVDTNDSLYCALQYSHKVIKRSLNSSDNQLTAVAGTDCAGYQSHKLYYPRGIFVDIKFDLYVADTGNHRIQRFQPGQLNGITLAGSETPGTIQLRFPSAVMLDSDGYIFILDTNNFRIVGSGPFGFWCVIGCTGVSGSASNQLSYSQSMAFDSYGNIYVCDRNNQRIQKFLLSFNYCSKWEGQINSLCHWFHSAHISFEALDPAWGLTREEMDVSFLFKWACPSLVVISNFILRLKGTIDLSWTAGEMEGFLNNHESDSLL